MKSSLPVLSALSLVFSAAGCGNSPVGGSDAGAGEEPGDGGAGGQRDAFTPGPGRDAGPLVAGDAGHFSQEYCSLVVGCCRPATSDLASCQQELEFKMLDRAYDPGAGEACLAWLRTATQDGDFCSTMAPLEGPDCRSAILGSSQALGASCRALHDEDCLGSTDGQAECFSGPRTTACVVRKAGKAGDSPCIGNTNAAGMTVTMSPDPPFLEAVVCREAEGTYCDFGSRTCKAFVGVGAPCPDDEECDPRSAFCDSEGTQKCVACKTAGQACEPAGRTTCCASAWCNPATRKCEARGGESAPCDTGDACTSGICFGDKCASVSPSGPWSLVCP